MVIDSRRRQYFVFLVKQTVSIGCLVFKSVKKSQVIRNFEEMNLKQLIKYPIYYKIVSQ